MYNTLKCCVFGLSPSSCVLKTQEDQLLELQLFPFLRWGGDIYSVRFLRNSWPQYWITQRQSQSYITTDSLSVSPSWYQALIWDPRPIFAILDLFFDSFGFIDVERPLWREVGSVLFSFCRTSPAQPFSDLRPMGLMSIVYCLYFWDSPNQEGQVPVFISHRNRVAQIPSGIGFG
jgi:hypothetical protein